MDNAFVNACVEVGSARLRMAQDAKTPADWKALSIAPVPFAFDVGECWKTNIIYRVQNLAAEPGFYMGILGMSIMSFDQDYIMLNTGDGYCISLIPAKDGNGTHPDSITFEFMVDDIHKAAEVLTQRGASFEQTPAPDMEGSPVYTGVLRTPNGIALRIWGLQE